MIRQKLELLKKTLEEDLLKANGPKKDHSDFDKYDVPEETRRKIKRATAHLVGNTALMHKIKAAREAMEESEDSQLSGPEWDKKRERLIELEESYQRKANVAHKIYRRLAESLPGFGGAYADSSEAKAAFYHDVDRDERPRLQDVHKNIDQLVDLNQRLKDWGFNPKEPLEPVYNENHHNEAHDWHYKQGLKKGASTADRRYHHQMAMNHAIASGSNSRYSYPDFADYSKRPKSDEKYTGRESHPYDKELIGEHSAEMPKKNFLKSLATYNNELAKEKKLEAAHNRVAQGLPVDETTDLTEDSLREQQNKTRQALSKFQDRVKHPLVDSDLVAHAYAKHPEVFKKAFDRYQSGYEGAKGRHVLHDMKFLEKIFDHSPHPEVLQTLFARHHSRIPAKIKRKFESGENPAYRNVAYINKDFDSHSDYEDAIKREELAGDLPAVAQGLVKNSMFKGLDSDQQYKMIKNLSDDAVESLSQTKHHQNIDSPTANKLMREDFEKYGELFSPHYADHKLEDETFKNLFNHKDPSARSTAYKHLGSMDHSKRKEIVPKILDRLIESGHKVDQMSDDDPLREKLFKEKNKIHQILSNEITGDRYSRGQDHNASHLIAPLLKHFLKAKKAGKEKVGMSPTVNDLKGMLQDAIDPENSKGPEVAKAYFKLMNDPDLNLPQNWTKKHLHHAPEDVIRDHLSKIDNFRDLGDAIQNLGVLNRQDLDTEARIALRGDEQEEPGLRGQALFDHRQLREKNERNLSAAADAIKNLYDKRAKQKLGHKTPFGVMPSSEEGGLPTDELSHFGEVVKDVLEKGLPMNKVKELVNSTALPPTAYLMSPDHTPKQAKDAFDFYKDLSDWDRDSVRPEVNNLIRSPWFSQEMADHMTKNTKHLGLGDLEKINQHKNDIKLNHSDLIKNLSSEKSRNYGPKGSDLSRYLEGAKDKLEDSHWKEAAKRFEDNPAHIAPVILKHLPKEDAQSIISPLHSHDQWNAFADRDDVTADDLKEYPITDRTEYTKLHPKIMRTFTKNPEEHPDLKLDHSKLTNEAEHVDNPAAVEHLKTLLHNNDGKMKWSEIKKQMPQWENLEGIKKAVGGKAEVTLADVQKNIENAPKKKWHITHTNWDGMQRHNNKNQLVVQLNTSNDFENDLKKTPGEHDVFQKIQKAAHSSVHPVLPHSVGWARVDTSNPKHWFIDEIQSDLAATLNPNRLTRHFDEEKLKQAEGHLKNIKKKTGDWHEHLLNHVMHLAHQHGVERISMHSPETKAAMNLGRDAKVPGKYKEIYGKVAKRAGFNSVAPKEAGIVARGHDRIPHGIESEVSGFVSKDTSKNMPINTYNLVDRHSMPAGKTVIEPKVKDVKTEEKTPETPTATTATREET